MPNTSQDSKSKTSRFRMSTQSRPFSRLCRSQSGYPDIKYPNDSTNSTDSIDISNSDRRKPVFRRLHKAYKSLLTNFTIKKSSSTPLKPTEPQSSISPQPSISQMAQTAPIPRIQLVPSSSTPQKPTHNPLFSQSAVEPVTTVPFYTPKARPFSQFIGISCMNEDNAKEEEEEEEEEEAKANDEDGHEIDDDHDNDNEEPNDSSIIVTCPVDIISTTSSSSSSLHTEDFLGPQLESTPTTFNDLRVLSDPYSLTFTFTPIKNLETPKTFASRIDFIPILPLRTRSAALRKSDIQQQKALAVWKKSIIELQQKTYSQSLISDIHHQRLTLPETKRTALVNFILHEIVTTEQSYHQLLTLIETRHMREMVQASKEKVPLVKSTDIPVLFGHLPVLLALSNQILEAFKAQPPPPPPPHTSASTITIPTPTPTPAWQPWSVPVGQTFCSLSQPLVIFLQYAIHYRTHSRIIQKACNNTVFTKIDQKTLRRRDTNRLGMSDFLIAPIQRVPRYCMLLKDLLKYTDRSDKDHEPLTRALCTLTGLVMAMNHDQPL